MNVHKLIEDLKHAHKSRFSQKHPGDWEHLDILIPQLENSAKFEYDDDLIAFSDNQMLKAIRSLKLPYKNCYFDFGRGASVLASDNDDYVLLQPFYKRQEGWLFIPPQMLICMNKESGDLVSLAKETESKALLKEFLEDQEFCTLIAATASFIVRFVTILNCSNVYINSNAAPGKLNKKRIKKGKVPLYEYKTLHFKIPNKYSKKEGVINGGRNSPRVHLRRGHIRNCGDVSIWVQPCVVGSKQRGIVHKDYDVVAG